MRNHSTHFLAGLFLAGCLVSQSLLAQERRAEADLPALGAWHAWVDCPGGELPFTLRFHEVEGKLAAVIRNGPERIDIPVVSFAGRRLTLGIDYYDSRISAELDAAGKRFDGEWTKRRAGTKVQRMAFHATHETRPRFRSTVRERSQSGKPTRFDGRWRVQFKSDEHPAVGLFESKRDSELHGTFLTTLGDYRYLAGNRIGATFRLSCFDGAHAFLFRARLDDEGVLHGDFWSSDSWHETWTARRDEAASLPDAWNLTTADTSGLGRLRFPDTEGKARSLSDPKFAGKARLIVVFGTWCPNCKDASSYMVELDRQYRDRGLSIVGLAFEHSGDKARDLAQLKLYKKRQGIRYPVLLAGLSDKKKATQALSLLDRVRSYPTFLFLKSDGAVHSIYTGFSGPGTGAEHQRLREQFESRILGLLGT